MGAGASAEHMLVGQDFGQRPSYRDPGPHQTEKVKQLSWDFPSGPVA